MTTIKKTIIVLPYELLATKEIVEKLRKEFPSLFDTNQIHFTRIIDENLSFISEGDTVVIEDDTDYTITSLMTICQKTKNPIIVLEKDEKNSFVKIFISEMI